MSTEKLSAVDRIAETTHRICKWAEERLASGNPLSAAESEALEQISTELRTTAKNLRELLNKSTSR